MNDPYRYPKLRWPIDLKFEKVENNEILVLRCPLGVAAQPLLLVPQVAPLIAHFDGQTEIAAIVSKFEKQGVSAKILNELVGILDQAYFLQTPRFDAADSAMRQAFKTATSREAFLAGSAYPADAGLLCKELEVYLSSAKRLTTLPAGKLLALIAPHIDYQRGHLCYAHTYKQLSDKDVDLYILLGTSHQYSEHMFHLTLKDFQSPLGALRADRDFISKVAALYGDQKSFADEFLHKREHSLELQVPFLRHICGEKNVAPILVGSFHSMLNAGRAPSSFDQYENFVGALCEVIKSRAHQSICFIVGVDMAHVGRFFGDAGNLTPAAMSQVEARDRIYLDAVSRGDKGALFAHIEEDQDARRICGFPSIYLLLDLFERLGWQYESRLFDYRQAVDYQSDCAVTFAGMGLYSK